SDPERQKEAEAMRVQRRVLEPLRVLVLTGVLALVGSRVAALVVLEFSLRAVSTILSPGKGSPSSQLYLLCQYSLGCGMSCSLTFLLEGAPHATCNLGRGIWGSMGAVCSHICILPYRGSMGCPWGMCSRVSWGCMGIQEASQGVIWGILGICRDLGSIQGVCGVPCGCLGGIWGVLELYAKPPQSIPTMSPGGQSIYQTVLVRMGGLFILLLTVGQWADVLHVLVSLVGEFWCLLQAGALLESCQGQ
ncbi:Transmembrane protein 82, partial [Calypte anna]